MSKIFNKKTVFDLEIVDEDKQERQCSSQIGINPKSYKLESFPFKIFKEYLLEIDIHSLANVLHESFFSNLPHKIICKDCPGYCRMGIKNVNKPVKEWSCGPAYIELEFVRRVAAFTLIKLIEGNRTVLNKEIIQRLVVLFFTEGFEFKNLHTAFNIGEILKYLTKEGFKEISRQLEQMEQNAAIRTVNENYIAIIEDQLFTKLGDPGYTDLQKIEKRFWKNKKEIFEHRREFEGKNKPKISFKTTLSQDQIKNLSYQLISKGIIDKTTSEGLFLKVFSGVDLNTIHSKIEWLKANNLLAYFIDAMIRYNIIEEINHWDIALQCFTNSKNLANASAKYKETKTGQPKYSELINEILKGL